VTIGSDAENGDGGVDEVDGVIAELMVAMSVGQSVGQSL